MRTRKLGNTELYLTTIGLGAWAIGGEWQYAMGAQDDNDSISTIMEAIDAGINWIDTAPIYGCGHSEEVVGKAIKGMIKKPLIATKCGLAWNKKREMIHCLKKEKIIAECDASLKRLGVEAIDLYQMHWPDENIEEGFEAMAQCVKSGKVRYIGVSNFTVEQMKRIEGIHPIASLQPHYSMLEREFFEKKLRAYCNEKNIGVLAYSPMETGLLTGKFSKERLSSFTADDVRFKIPNFNEPLLSKNLEFVENIRPIAERNSITVAQLAIAWVLRKEGVTNAIVGARRPGQITETAKAGDVILSGDDIAEIEKLLEQREEKLK